jgi:hypothetical protein
VVFFAYGAQKMLGTSFLNLPVPRVFLAVTAEFLGGAGLIAGLIEPRGSNRRLRHHVGDCEGSRPLRHFHELPGLILSKKVAGRHGLSTSIIPKGQVRERRQTE